MAPGSPGSLGPIAGAEAAQRARLQLRRQTGALHGRPICSGLSVSFRPGQVKQLRLEREREKAMREQELEMLQREKEAEHFKTWEEQEDNFHLQQAKLR